MALNDNHDFNSLKDPTGVYADGHWDYKNMIMSSFIDLVNFRAPTRYGRSKTSLPRRLRMKLMRLMIQFKG